MEQTTLVGRCKHTQTKSRSLSFVSEMLPLTSPNGKGKAVFNKGSVDAFYVVVRRYFARNIKLTQT